MKKLVLFFLPLVLCTATTAVYSQCTGPAGDCDGDGVVNNLDLDDDNDGILDTEERGCITAQNGSLGAPVNTVTSGTHYTRIIGNFGIRYQKVAGSGSNNLDPITNELVTGSNLLFATNTPTSYLTPGAGNGNTAEMKVTFFDNRTGLPMNASFTFLVTDIDAGSEGEIVRAFNAAGTGINPYPHLTATYTGTSGTYPGSVTSATYNDLGSQVNKYAPGTFVNATFGTVPANAVGLVTDNTGNVNTYVRSKAVAFDFTAQSFSGFSVATHPSTGPAYGEPAVVVPNACGDFDTDGDGIPDYQDTDSDNDGCPDAIEGAANFTMANLDANGRLTGSVNANGVPMATGSPQSGGSAYNAAINACSAPVSGTIYDDNNGPTGGVNGSPMPAGITVTLYAANGTTIIATTTTDVSGHYTFASQPPGNYIVGITLPAGYSNVSATDATPANGLTSVVVGSGIPVTNINFGINQPPAATNDNLNNQPPGSAATVPNILANDTDPNSGTLSPDSISLVAPPGATGITIDAQGDVTGFTVPGQGTWSLNSITGALTFTPQAGFTGDPTPISYSVTDEAGLTSNTATVTIDYNPPVTVSGTVYNDNNAGTPNGTVPPGTTVTLYASDGTTVLATTITDANGNYSFPNQVPGNYVIGVTPPAGYQNVSSTDATPANGLTNVTVGSTAVTGVNFGINQPPVATADVLNNQAPGAPATIPNLLANDSDPNSGTLSPDSISLVAPSGATGITIDAQGDVTGFTVPGQGTWSLNSSTGALTFTPQTGFTGDPTPIIYTVTDAAGLTSSPVPVTIDYNPPVTVSGTLFTDANGQTGGVNGTPLNGVTVTLYDNDGTTVIATTVTNASGNYSFPNLLPGNYVIGVTPPAGYQNVSSTDVTPANGLTSVTVGSTALTGVNFGMEQPPVSAPQTQTISGPTGTTIPAGTVNQNVSGSDPEDGILGNANTIVITQLPANGTLLYNGVPVTLNQQITNFNPALLSFTGITQGSVSVAFNYSFMDGAGLQGVPATYNVSWSTPLPVTLEYFTAALHNCNEVMLRWQVNDAVQFGHFEVEESHDGTYYRTRAVVTYKSDLERYHYSSAGLTAGRYYYRLKLVDVDGRSAYSNVLSVTINCQEKLVKVYPNPVMDKITVSGLESGALIQLHDNTGRLLYRGNTAGYQMDIDMANYAAGTYYLTVTGKTGEKLFGTKLMKTGR